MAKKDPPKVGEIRIGRAGNKYNRWDGTRWVPVSAARTAGAGGRKPSVVSKPVPVKKPQPETPKVTKANKAPEGPKRPSKRSVVFGGAGSRSIKSKRSVTTNRPERGKAMQLVTERDGTRRWVTYVKPTKGKK